MTSRIALFGRIKDEIGLFAIDESHCVSQWSHDFRVSYLELGIIKTTYPDIPMLAVTATATPRVVDDIYEFLNIDDVNEYSLGSRAGVQGAVDGIYGGTRIRPRSSQGIRLPSVLVNCRWGRRAQQHNGKQCVKSA